MKKICDMRCYVAIGKGEYMDTSIWKHWRYCEEGECEETFNYWHDLYVCVKHNFIRNATVDKTIFGNDAVRFSWGSFSRSHSTMTERTFKPVRVKWVAEPVTTHYSFQDLKDLLPAEDFCEYLKDQEIEIWG